MSVQVEKLEKNMAKLTIEVSSEEFEKAIDKAYKKNKNKISMPGFRKGKAPRAMIEKMYGKGVFYEDAANSIIPDAYADAAKESELEIVAQPEIDVTQIHIFHRRIFHIFNSNINLYNTCILIKTTFRAKLILAHKRHIIIQDTANCNIFSFFIF